MQMLKYSIKRLLLIIPVMLGVMLIVFIFKEIAPGDPAVSIIGAGATQEEYDDLSEKLGLNDPFVVQYFNYVKDLFTKGSLGTSYKTGQSVTHELMSRFPYTLKLTILSMVLAIIIGIPLGVISAVKQYTWADSTILAVSVFGSSVPGFWLALMLISLFGVTLRWVPTMGIQDPKGWILPIVVVVLQGMGNISRVTRSSMLETIRQDYVRTAYAKGQTKGKVMINHALRNSLIPIVSSVGNTIGIQLGGALIIESVFGLPGIGRYAVDAITQRDYPAVLGSVVFLSFIFAVVNLLIDLVCVVVDPRMKTNLLKRKAA